MKKLIVAAALFSAFAGLAGIAKADTLVQVPNGSGTYRAQDQALFFYDANGNYIWLGGKGGYVVIYYKDGTSTEFQGYVQTGSAPAVGTSSVITGTFQGTDEKGNAYSASVTENLFTKKVTGGSGRGGGYKSSVTSVTGGEIDYNYPTVALPPLVSPTTTWTSDASSVTLTWNPATGGAAPYDYSVLDVNGATLATTTGLTATIPGLGASTTYEFTLVTTDASGATATTTIDAVTAQLPPPPPAPTPAPTLNTMFTCNTDGTVAASWNADPNAVSYSVFGYDWTPGTWTNLADTTGLNATVADTGTNGITYLQGYVASYDANGVETDWDQQAFPSCATPVVNAPVVDSGMTNNSAATTDSTTTDTSAEL